MKSWQAMFLAVTLPVVRNISWILLPLQQSHIWCHSSKQDVMMGRTSSLAGSFIFVIGKYRADLAAVLDPSLPQIPKWLEIKHKKIVLLLSVVWVQCLIIFCTRSISSLNPLTASRFDKKSEKIIFKFFSLLRQIRIISNWEI